MISDKNATYFLITHIRIRQCPISKYPNFAYPIPQHPTLIGQEAGKDFVADEQRPR